MRPTARTCVSLHDYACQAFFILEPKFRVSVRFIHVLVNIILPCLATYNIAATDRGSVTVPQLSSKMNDNIE